MYIKQKKQELLSRADKEITNFVLSIIKTKFSTRFVEFIDTSNMSWYYLEECLHKIDKRSIQKPEDRTVADNGFYLVRFKDKKSYALYIKYKDSLYLDSDYKFSQLQKTKLYIIGPNRKKYKNKLIEYINNKTSNRNGRHGQLHIQRLNNYPNIMKTRSMNSIYTKKENKESIINSLQKFISNKEIYDRIGIVHKLGIMLYGKPGTGKTSMIRAICSEICRINKNPVRITNINMSDITDSRIDLLSSYQEELCNVYIIEDIDCITVNREENNDIEYKKALYKLLEFLDGISSAGEMICIATTNHINKLDSALTREGRFDIKIEMGDIDESQAVKMCSSFKLTEEEIKEILHDVEFPVNPSYLQNKILYKFK